MIRIRKEKQGFLPSHTRCDRALLIVTEVLKKQKTQVVVAGPPWGTWFLELPNKLHRALKRIASEVEMHRI